MPNTTSNSPDDTHAGQPVLTAGAPLATASVAVVMLHGRGASAESILTLEPLLRTPAVSFLAPQAAGGTWYPYSFLSPISTNEPAITSSMNAITRLITDITTAGIPIERTLLLGFSQGACLATEYIARHARQYAGLASLSGGLIGPDDTPRNYPGSLSNTPIFLGCGTLDDHIPTNRVRESAEVLRHLGGTVTMRLYPGMGHTVNDDEIETVRAMLTAATNPIGPNP